MGLDMYAYSANKAGAQNEYYENGEWVKVENGGSEFVSTCTKPKELAYWRKHPNLHGWMEELWRRKGKPADKGADMDFNGIELELTWEDLTQLEEDVNAGRLPATSGFFFGDGADDYYKEDDLRFIKEAKADLFLGLKVYYNSSW